MKWLGIIVIALVLLAVAFFALAPGIIEDTQNVVEPPHEPWPVSPRASRLHEQLVVADLHSDTLLWARDPLKRSRHGHVDIPRLREGNVALQVFPAVTKSPDGQNYDSNTADSDTITALTLVQLWPVRTWTSLLERALFQAQRLRDASIRAPDELQLITSKAELQALLQQRADGRDIVGGLLATEGGHPLEGEIENLERLADAGYRIIGLQHFFDNALGGSLHGVSKAGLTDFGKLVVKEVERMGLILDLAHSSPAVVEDVLAQTTRPFMVSHTGLKGACDTPRNLEDDLFLRVAESGGLIGIGYWDAAACNISPAGIAASIRYAINLLGVDHVALGSDYDGTTTVTFDTSKLAVLTHAMLGAGFTEREIRKVMGENAVRFFLATLPE